MPKASAKAFVVVRSWSTVRLKDRVSASIRVRAAWSLSFAVSILRVAPDTAVFITGRIDQHP